MPQLQVQVRRSVVGDDIHVVWLTLDGFLDASTVLSFENTLEVLHSDERGEIVLDLGRLLYANSSAIGTILNYRNLLLEAGRELILVNVHPQVQTTFDLLGLSAVVPCLPDEAAAAAYLQSAPAGDRDAERFRRGAGPAEADDEETRAVEPIQSVEPAECHVMMIVPEENRFTDIMRQRLATPHGVFRIVSDCTEALHVFDDMHPDLVVLEDPLAGSDDFVWRIKTERGKSIVPIVKLYWTGTNLDERKEFRVWEDDFLVEPFELMELFVLSERELRRIPEDRKVLLHQTHFEFRTREENLRRANDLAASFFQKAGLSGEAITQLAAGFAEALEPRSASTSSSSSTARSSPSPSPTKARASTGVPTSSRPPPPPSTPPASSSVAASSAASASPSCSAAATNSTTSTAATPSASSSDSDG